MYVHLSQTANNLVRKVSKALIVFDPAPVPKFLLVVTDDLDVVPLIRVSVFHVPSLKLEKIFSVNAPIMRLDPDMNGDISDQKLVFYGQQKNQNCCVLFIIDLENEQVKRCKNWTHKGGRADGPTVLQRKRQSTVDEMFCRFLLHTNPSRANACNSLCKNVLCTSSWYSKHASLPPFQKHEI